MIQKETQQGEVEAAVFGGAAAVSEELHMWTVTRRRKYLILCFFLPVFCATLFLSNLRLYVSDLTPVAPYIQLSLD